MRLPFLFKLIFNRYFFEKLVALIVLGILLYALESFLLIFLFSFLFAYLFLDLARWLVQKIDFLSGKMKHVPIRTIIRKCNKLPVIITIVYVAFIAMIIAMFYSLIPHLIEETQGLIKVAPKITNQLQAITDKIQGQVSFDLGLDQAFETLVSKANVETTLKNIFENIRLAGVFLLEIVIALILSYVFIIDRSKIDQFMNGLKWGNFSFLHEQFSLIFEKITKSFGLLFKAQAIIAFINAILTSVGLLLISFIHGGDTFPFIATIAVVVFIMGFIPVFGFLISSVPVFLIGFNYGGMNIIISLLIMTAIIHSVEAYYLNPKIVSSYMEFPVFITFVVLLISEHYMGFIGLLIGVPLFYIIIDLAKDFDEYVNKIRKISQTIDTQKVSTKEAIHKNIRLSRSGKRASE